MKENHNHYTKIYRVDARDEWMNTAYDEDGNAVTCEHCLCEMKWDSVMQVWYCPVCESKMDRPSYFAYIGAQPPGSDCITNCCENYPFCKKYCEHYTIDPEDPMLT